MKDGKEKKTFSSDFSKGSMAKLILRQALPLSISQLALILYNIIDRIYIGHIDTVSGYPLTGLGLTLPLVSMISAVTLLVGQGGAPIFSIARGAKETKRAARIMGNSFTLLIIASIVLTVLGYIFMKPVLYAFGAGDMSWPYARDYLNIYLAGTFFTVVATGLNFYITAQGHPKTAMITILSGSILNIILDPLFIFVLGLGIRGAAIATVISQFVSFVWVMLFFIGDKAEIKLTRENMKLDPKTCAKITAMGFTGFIMEITNCATQITCNRTLRFWGGEELGDTYINIMTIVSSVRSVMGVAVTGITSGAQPVLGYNYGAHKWDRVKAGIRWSALFGFAYTALAWLIVFLFPGFFISLFGQDPGEDMMAVRYLHIFFMAYVFMSLQFSGQSTFMALGKAKQAISFSIFRKVILVIPLTLILPYLLADHAGGVFWAEPISNAVGGAASFFTMYFTVYRRLGKSDV